jgi:hypothetical protein
MEEEGTTSTTRRPRAETPRSLQDWAALAEEAAADVEDVEAAVVAEEGDAAVDGAAVDGAAVDGAAVDGAAVDGAAGEDADAGAADEIRHTLSFCTARCSSVLAPNLFHLMRERIRIHFNAELVNACIAKNEAKGEVCQAKRARQNKST